MMLFWVRKIYNRCISFASNFQVQCLNFQSLPNILQALSISTRHFPLESNARLRHSRNEILWAFDGPALLPTILSSKIQTEAYRYICLCTKSELGEVPFLNKCNKELQSDVRVIATKPSNFPCSIIFNPYQSTAHTHTVMPNSSHKLQQHKIRLRTVANNLRCVSKHS